MLRTILLAVALAFPAPALADITGLATVIDGDTIDIAGERIRLHGIDAPEYRQTCIADGVTWPCGQSATDALAEFIGDSPVRCEEQGTDRYGRTIATCYVRGEDIASLRAPWLTCPDTSTSWLSRVNNPLIHFRIIALLAMK